jgi:hypothetical protein
VDDQRWGQFNLGGWIEVTEREKTELRKQVPPVHEIPTAHLVINAARLQFIASIVYKKGDS